MANEVIYVRNLRPNGLIIKLNGLKYPVLERRGARGDTMALPVEAENDPIVAKFLRTGYLEQISKEAFFELSSRTEDTRFPLRTRKHEHAATVAIPMNSESSAEPYVIKDKDLAETAHLRSPNLELERVVSTDVELGFAPDEEAIARQAELDRAADEKTRGLQDELAAVKEKLAALEAQAAKAEEKPKRAPAKRKTTTKKRS